MGHPRKDILDGRDYGIIRALANNNMRIDRAAEDLYMARGTVTYHMDKIKRITGLDPRNFYDLHKLVALFLDGDAYKKCDGLSEKNT